MTSAANLGAIAIAAAAVKRAGDGFNGMQIHNLKALCASTLSDEDAIIAGVRMSYPDDIQEHGADEAAFTRPEELRDDDDTAYPTEESGRFYWSNLDGDRFYFPTYEAAALDLAEACDLHAPECREAIRTGRPVA